MLCLARPGGGNTITVGNMVGGGVSSLKISYGASHTLPNTVSVAGSAGADTYTINSATDALPAIPSATNLTPGAGITVPTVNVNRTGGLQIEVFGISHTAGDTLAVNSKGGNDSFYVESLSLPTTIQGNDVNASAATPFTTTYYVGWVGLSIPGSLSLIAALLTIDGTNGTDTLEMFDNSDLFNRTFNLTDTQMFSDALGTNGRLVYNNKIDTFDLFAGPGQNSYVVTGTGAVGQTHIIAGDTNLSINAGSITTPTSVDGGANLGLNYNGDPLVVGNVLFVNGTAGDDTFVISPGEIDVTANGGSLTVPIFFTNFQSVVIEGVGGDDTYTINGNSINLLIDDPLYNGNSNFSSPSYTQVSGSATYVVNGNSGALTLFGGSTGTNHFTIQGNSGSIDINDPTRVGADQGNGSGVYTVNGNSSDITINGLAGTNTFNINGNSKNLTLTGGEGLSAANTFNILGNFGAIAVTSEGGTNNYNITGISSPISLVTSGYRPATYTVTAPLHASVSITGYPGRSSMATLVSELNTDTVGDDIEGTFKGYGIVLSSSATLVTNSSTSWTITDGTSTYAINEDGNGLLTITKASSATLPFTDPNVGGADAAALHGGTVSAGLLALFTSHSLTLSGGQTVTTVSPTVWTITDGGNSYRVIETPNGLLTISRTGTAGLPFTDADVNADIAALNSSTISANLSSLFTIAGITLTSPTVTVNSATSWSIVSGTKTYSVTEQSNGTLAIADSTGKLLFSDTPADVTALNNASVSANLTSLFTTAGITLASPSVTINSATSWAIVNGTSTYSVTEESNGTLVIADSTTGGLPFVDADAGGADAMALNAKAISTRLSDAFAADSITLTSPTVVVEVPGSEWLIFAGGNYYLVTENAGLQVTPYTFVADSTGTGFVPPTQTLGINGTSGNENFTLSPTSVTGVGSAINYTGLMAVSINGNGGTDSFTITGNTAATTITTGIGTGTINVSNLSAPLTINSQLGVNTITFGNLLSNLAGAIKIHGSGSDTLTLNDPANNTGTNGTLTSTTYTLTNSTFGGLTYSGISSLTINLGGGADTLLITSTLATTPITISTGSGADVVNVQNTSSAVSISTGTGTDTINVGSLAPTLIGGNLSLIQGALTITAGGNTTLVLDDDGDATSGTAMLTSTTFTGLAMIAAGITYSGLSNLDLALGNNGNALTVVSTAAGTSYAITGGTGGDTINVQSTNATGPVAITTGSGTNVVNIASTTNTLAGILGQISITGTGTDTLNLNDSGSSANRTINITSTQIGITGVAAVLYTTIDTLNITLGSGTITGTINSTAVGTNTTLITGSGNNLITINGTSTANTTVITGTGNDTIIVNAIGGPTTVNAGTGTNSVTVGTAAHLLSGIAAALTITGGGTDTITLDDSSDVAATISTLSATDFSMTTPATGDITFGGDTTLSVLNVNLGSAGITLTITGTPVTATTTVGTGNGADTVTIQGTNGVTILNTAGGNDTVHVQAIGAALTINTGAGTNGVTVASSANKLDGIQGLLTVNGGGTDTLAFNDSGASTAVTATLTSSTLAGLNMAVAGAVYSGITTFNLDLGTGGTTLSIASTNAATTTNINATSGNDNITLVADSGVTNINAGTGTTTTHIESTGAATTVITTTGGHNTMTVSNNGEVDDIAGLLKLMGNGSDIVIVDDSNSLNTKLTATLTVSALKNLSPADIDYSNVASLTIKLGTAPDTFTIVNTGSLSPRSISARPTTR